MKKLILTTIAILMATSALGMTSMPEGRFEGQARWKDKDGQSGTYQKKTVIAGDFIENEYQYGNGKQSQTRTFDFKAPVDALGFFPVVIDGKEVGRGYCMSVQCHYAVDLGGAQIEETFSFVNEKLYIVGSKTVGDKVISWEESLTKETK